MKLTDSELRAVICFHADMLANDSYVVPKQILIEWAERLRQLVTALPDDDGIFDGLDEELRKHEDEGKLN